MVYFLYAGTHDDGHLILNGGTIRNAGTLVDAGLTLQSVGLGVQSNAKVDGSIGGHNGLRRRRRCRCVRF